MPTIEFDDFSIRKDLRKGESVADANRLRELKNAYVTTGKVITKRPGTTKRATLESGTKGLIAANGKLNTFYEDGTITHGDSLFVANKVDHGSVVTPVDKLEFGDSFLGFMWVTIRYQNGDIKHHYFDQSPSLVTETNLPEKAAVIKAQSKMWVVKTDTVRFSATRRTQRRTSRW